MSELRAATISNLAGTGPVTLTGQYAAKAWVNFDGTGTVAIRESGNISSLTDEGVGDYLANMTNAMISADYGGAAAGATTGNVGFDDGSQNTSVSISLGGFSGAAARADLASIFGNSFGDLA